jgi:hypothetical protein
MKATVYVCAGIACGMRDYCGKHRLSKALPAAAVTYDEPDAEYFTRDGWRVVKECRDYVARFDKKEKT